jgi:hypothetical protein
VTVDQPPAVLPPPAQSWEDWAPPLNPPDDPGVDATWAAAIADLWWDTDPHYCAGLLWQNYAALLGSPPGPPVQIVATGVQTVRYQQGNQMPSGPAGEAMAMAQWHFSLSYTGYGGIKTVPLNREMPVQRMYYGWGYGYGSWPVWPGGPYAAQKSAINVYQTEVEVVSERPPNEPEPGEPEPDEPDEPEPPAAS